MQIDQLQGIAYNLKFQFSHPDTRKLLDAFLFYYDFRACIVMDEEGRCLNPDARGGFYNWGGTWTRPGLALGEEDPRWRRGFLPPTPEPDWDN
jgi:hypothetical protein